MSIVSAIETVGDISGIAKGGANREATDKELQGGTYADGIRNCSCWCFWRPCQIPVLAKTLDLISMTGVMSRSVVTIAAIFLVLCGLVPKIGAISFFHANSCARRRSYCNVWNGCICGYKHA